MKVDYKHCRFEAADEIRQVNAIKPVATSVTSILVKKCEPTGPLQCPPNTRQGLSPNITLKLPLD